MLPVLGLCCSETQDSEAPRCGYRSGSKLANINGRRGQTGQVSKTGWGGRDRCAGWSVVTWRALAQRKGRPANCICLLPLQDGTQ